MFSFLLERSLQKREASNASRSVIHSGLGQKARCARFLIGAEGASRFILHLAIMLPIYFDPHTHGIARMCRRPLRPLRSAKRAGAHLLTFRLLAVVCACVLIEACGTLPGEGEKGKGEVDTDPQIAALKQNSERNAADARAHYELGNALYDARSYLEAIAAYSRAIEADPNFADAYTNLGLTYRQLDNISLALENYETSLALEPDDSATLRNMVIALRAGGMPERALSYLLRLVEAHAEDGAARSDLAESLFAVGRYVEASEHYRVLLELDPADLNRGFKLGSCYYFAEDWDKALATWAEIVQRDLNHGPAHRGMAMAYLKKGQYDSAWTSVGECERVGIALSAEFVSELRRVSGRLGPN